jgi:hypothetical protein
LQNYSDATTALSKTNWLMYSLTPLCFRWTVPLSGQIFTNSKVHKNIIPPSPGALDRYPAAVTAHLTMTSACKAGKFFHIPYLIITFTMPLLLILPESGYQMGPGVSRRLSTQAAHSYQQVPQLWPKNIIKEDFAHVEFEKLRWSYLVWRSAF